MKIRCFFLTIIIFALLFCACENPFWNIPKDTASSDISVYEITLCSEDIDFGAAVFGYEEPEAIQITVKNTGNHATGKLIIGINNIDAFTLSDYEIENLDIDSEAEFTIAVNTGLNTGEHTAIVSVTGENGLFAELSVRFQVVKNSLKLPAYPRKTVTTTARIKSLLKAANYPALKKATMLASSFSTA